jgi:hypothetical protein
MENMQAHFKETKDDLYSRSRVSRRGEERKAVIRGMQKFKTDAKRCRGATPLIMAASRGQETQQRPGEPFVGIGRMMETSS